MNNSAISITGLGKMYKLYRRQGDKVLDAFAVNRLLFWRKDYYQEFWALRDLSLEVTRGERLGIIGRNGAGKSTLLKVITGNIAPSEGRVQVNGRVQALLELGTGFHPEFTGRENIRASLAYQGLSPARIRDLEEDIVDFAELDAFIDQPIKTYSAGMYARLAFSTATAIKPEVLIVDEVLGAGDAYFAGKCVERMKSLTEGSGATVLFVSHDLGSVQQLCERVIWIDRGCIVMDGRPLEATKAYYASILAQEELRLRARNARLVRGQARELAAKEDARNVRELLFRLVTANGAPPTEAHPIRKITLMRNGARLDSVAPGAPMDNDPGQSMYLMTDKKHMLWREPEVVKEQRFRCFAATGGKFCHAPFVVEVANELWSTGGFELAIEHAAVPGDRVVVQVFDGQSYHTLGALTPGTGDWRTDQWALPMPVLRPEAASGDDLPAPDVYEGGAREAGAAELVAQEAAEVAVAAQANAGPVSDRGDGNDPDRPVLKQRTVDKFYSDYAEFTGIRLLGRSGRSQVIFTLGETIGVSVEAEVGLPIPVCEFGLVIYSLTNTVIAVGHWPIRGGLKPGRYEWTVTCERPVLRQHEYLVSCTLVREYSPASNEHLTYYAVWNRSLSFRVNEGQVGSTPLGLVSLQIDPPSGECLPVHSLVSK